MALAGRIDVPYYWYEGLADWTLLGAVPPVIPLGTQFALAVPWVNLGDVSARGRIDLTLTKPDGATVKLEATSGQTILFAPGEGLRVTFKLVPLDQIGQYSARVVLSMEEEAPAIVSFYTAVLNVDTAWFNGWIPLWSRGLSPADPNWDVWEPGDGGTVPISLTQKGHFTKFPSRGYWGCRLRRLDGGISGLYTPTWGEMLPTTVPEGATLTWNASSWEVTVA